MADLDFKAKVVAEGNMKLMFPQASPVAIASAAIGKDEQAVGIGIVTRTRLQPPGTDGINGELGSVATGANTYKPLIARKIINAIGDGNT